MTGDTFEESAEALLSEMERHGYTIVAIMAQGRPLGLYTGLPSPGRPCEIEHPLCERHRTLWEEDARRFLAHLVATGRHQPAYSPIQTRAHA